MKHLVLAGVASLAGLVPGQSKRPNVLLIVADDLGWNDVGYHGSRIRTPHLDALARRGVELDQCYVQPVCSPTRAALLTGRYPSRFGPHVLGPTNRRALPPGTETLASALASVGYDCAMAGKWHLGSRPEWGPQHYGFAHSYGSLTGAADPWTHRYRKGRYEMTWHRDLQPLEEKGNVTELLTHEVIGWIEARRTPWFLYVPYTAVHIPIDAPERFKELYAGETFYDDPVENESFTRYAAYVSQLDAAVGELIATLERTDQRTDTLVVFLSDNGGLPSGGNPYVGDVPPAPVAGSNLPLRGHKAQLYEGGIRVPAFASWPGVLEPRRVRAPIHAVDWMPTLTRLCGYRPDRDLHYDGHDIGPQLRGEPAEPRTIYWAYRRAAALRHGDWKLIARRSGKRQLFDLAHDPCEKHDLAVGHPERVAELEALLAAEQAADVTEVPADLRKVPER